MDVAVRRPRMSMDEFLVWESQQEGRWEFDGFEPCAMVGANSRHHRIIAAVAAALRELRGGRCLVYTETMKLKLGRTWPYPDLMVVCSEVADEAPFVSDPIVVIEVLSASTARDDRIFKNREYEEVASIQRYVVLEQEVQAAEIYSRDGGHWVRSTVVNDGNLMMPEIGVQIPLTDAYAGLGVPPYVPAAQDAPDHA